MIKEAYEKIFGTTSQHVIKKYWPVVDKIEALEPEMEKLSDKELTAKTQEFKDRLAKGETLDDIMVEAFAVVREASKRTIGKRHFRVQLLGGILLHKGVIVEMKTGEGKTLTATAPSYLNALDRLFLLDNDEPFLTNIRSSVRVKQSEKRHFVDPSLACAILSVSNEKT